MAITKQKKEEIIKNLQDNFKKAKIIVFVNFHGLNVAAAGELRDLLRDAGANYLVAKKTLIKRAFETIGFAGEMPELDGELGLAFSEDGDAVASAKTLKDFAKKNNIKLLGGVFENEFIGSETVVMLANIPSREVLLGQLVNVINSPIQGIAGTLNAVVSGFVRVISEVNKSRS